MSDHEVVIRSDPHDDRNGIDTQLVCLHGPDDLTYAAREDEGEGRIIRPIECAVQSWWDAIQWEGVRWAEPAVVLARVPVDVSFEYGSGPIIEAAIRLGDDDE